MSNDYWKKRFEKLETFQINETEDFLRKQIKLYEKSISKLEKSIENWYNRLAVNNNVSMSEAKKLLTQKELQEFRWTVEEYIEKGKDNISGKWAKQLENASARVHISRLDSLKVEIRAEIEDLYSRLNTNIEESLYNLYENKYYKTAYEIQKGINTGFSLYKLDASTIEKTLKSGWTVDNKNFSSRIWKDKAKLLEKLNTDIVISTITGGSTDDLVRKISKSLDVSKNNVKRLVRTESAYISSLAEYDTLKELEVEEYEILATLDRRTSKKCQSLDGVVFKLSDYEIGTTAPPFHPNCRSTTVPYIDLDFGTRVARDKNNNIYINKNIKYEEWYNTFIKEK